LFEKGRGEPRRHNHLKSLPLLCRGQYLDIIVETKQSRGVVIKANGRHKPYGSLVPLGCDIAAFIPMAYQRGRLPRSFKEISSCGGFRAYMLSALIPSERSYPAVPLAGQLVHQR